MFQLVQRRARLFSTKLAASAVVAVAALVGLSACSRPPAFTNLDLTGNTAAFGTDFALPGTDGRVRTLADYRGKAVVLFFGYTHCPDVCPTTMAELAQAMKELGNDANRVQVLFVSLDPERDSAAGLAQYVAAFDPRFAALRPANAAQLKKVTGDFRIYFAKAPAAASGEYTVDHTAASYVFDPQGKLRLYARDGQGPAPWVHDLNILLD